MFFLPTEVILDILQRLRVKDLLRSRCVSKSLCALIDSPYFIQLHLKHSLQTASNLSIVLRGRELYSMEFEELRKSEQLKHPFENQRLTGVLGSSNGLVALLYADKSVALWNPSTRKYWKGPSMRRVCPNAYDDFEPAYGFGHDPVSDDYKLVNIAQFNRDDLGHVRSVVKVYSLKSSLWRKIQDLPYYIEKYGRIGVFAFNALHWVGLGCQELETDVSSLIVAFDIALEDYRLVPLPDLCDTDCDLNVFELGGCLGLTFNYYPNYVDVWVMKEYGVKESWTKLFSVDGWFNYVVPFAYSKDGKKVLMQLGDKLCKYDCKRNRVMSIKSQRFCPHLRTVFVESLVQLDNSCRIGSKNMRQEIRKRRRV